MMMEDRIKILHKRLVNMKEINQTKDSAYCTRKEVPADVEYVNCIRKTPADAGYVNCIRKPFANYTR
jgi:hypothetical protein